ncbi:MAG: hypothetical protein UH542_06050 [Bacteroidales bacterium]|nr:hypothetical protein [Bacteroidales bacterium]
MLVLTGCSIGMSQDKKYEIGYENAKKKLSVYLKEKYKKDFTVAESDVVTISGNYYGVSFSESDDYSTYNEFEAYCGIDNVNDCKDNYCSVLFRNTIVDDIYSSTLLEEKNFKVYINSKDLRSIRSLEPNSTLQDVVNKEGPVDCNVYICGKQDTRVQEICSKLYQIGLNGNVYFYYLDSELWNKVQPNNYYDLICNSEPDKVKNFRNVKSSIRHPQEKFESAYYSDEEINYSLDEIINKVRLQLNSKYNTEFCCVSASLPTCSGEPYKFEFSHLLPNKNTFEVSYYADDTSLATDGTQYNDGYYGLILKTNLENQVFKNKLLDDSSEKVYIQPIDTYFSSCLNSDSTLKEALQEEGHIICRVYIFGKNKIDVKAFKENLDKLGVDSIVHFYQIKEAKWNSIPSSSSIDTVYETISDHESIIYEEEIAE